MNIEEIREYVLTLPGATEDMPFGDDCVVYRIEGKIFMCLSLTGEEPHFAIKLVPERGEEMRALYAAVTPAWHWNKKYWNDVYYEQLDDTLVGSLLRESYMLVLSALPKSVKAKYQDFCQTL